MRTLNKKTAIILLFLSVAFTSCEYAAEYKYVIVNQTNNTVLIKTKKGSDINGIYFDDSIHTIKPGEKLEISQPLGLCGKDYQPSDVFESNDSVPPVTKFDISILQKRYKNLRLRKYWNYTVQTTLGIYTLTVTNELVEDL